ncbi:Copper-containing nitrite reductase [hydrothermal vent metagenome]|uniref:Copper-containing nitrite reductase n=1 Tax=hydrothermal vent metagenome TaxID=652676 RepID=A0A3B1CG83_9ZZZZ
MNLVCTTKKSILTVAAFMCLALLLTSGVGYAKTVKVNITAIEKDVAIDTKGTKYPAWTFGGAVPGPVVRVTQGDTVEFTMINDKKNGQSHSMDFHAAIVDVLDEFAPVKPGETKKFNFVAKYPGVFMYHCGAPNMAQHIARGMFGVIIVDPKEGYSKSYPKPDREYILIQSQYFPNAGDAVAMMENRGWTNSLINGKIFHYDPLHGPNAPAPLVAKPGERVRFFFVNANINMPVAFHPIAGIWDRVYLNGNPKNVIYGMATYNVAVSEAVTVDLVTPKGRSSNNAIVDHTMGAALRGAITVLVTSPDADDSMGKGDKILP